MPRPIVFYVRIFARDSGEPTYAWSNGGMVRWRPALTDGISGVERCEQQPKVAPVKPSPKKAPRQPAQKSTWNQNFDLKKGPKVWQAAQQSEVRREEA